MKLSLGDLNSVPYFLQLMNIYICRVTIIPNIYDTFSNYFETCSTSQVNSSMNTNKELN